MNNFKILIILIILNLSSVTFLISRDLHGTVFGIDAENVKTPLPKAGLHWLGSKNGVLTDKDGTFSIQTIKESNSLIISYVGYRKDTLIVGDNEKDIVITMKSDLTTDVVQITGQQPANMVSRSEPIKTEIITARGLTKAACCNLSESFQTNPSVDVSYTDAVSGAKQIQMLGLQGIYSQMLTEQIPNLRGLASIYGLNYIPGPWMESIQISKGTSSVVQGYESITGQINVEFKKAQNSDPLFLNFYGDNTGRIEGNINTAFKVAENLSTEILAHGSSLQTKIDLNNDGFLDKPLTNQLNFINSWSYLTPKWESRFGIKGLYEDRQAGQSNYFINRPDTLYGSEVKTKRFEIYTKNGFLFPETPYQSIGTIASLTYHNQNSFFGHNKYNGEQTNAYLNFIFSSHIVNEDIKYVAGISYLYDNFNESINDSAFRRMESVPGIFSEFTLMLFDRLTLIAGARADFNNLFGTIITPRLHLKYVLMDNLTFRASAGSGFRTPNIYAENIGLQASSRKLIVDEKLNPEKAWNYGINASYDFSIFDIDFTLNAEYYRTEFMNQVIVDMDRDPQAVHFYNLHGQSYSNSFQVDLTFSPFKKFDITAAYRMNDVKMTIDSMLMTKPLMNKEKVFLNLAYSTPDDGWKFDLTFDFNGGGRLPETLKNPVIYRLGSDFPSFLMVNSQITKSFGKWDFYIGCENLTNFRQPNPILAYDKPFSPYFDSSIIWGPIFGRVVYFGTRINLFAKK